MGGFFRSYATQLRRKHANAKGAGKKYAAIGRYFENSIKNGRNQARNQAIKRYMENSIRKMNDEIKQDVSQDIIKDQREFSPEIRQELTQYGQTVLQRFTKLQEFLGTILPEQRETTRIVIVIQAFNANQEKRRTVHEENEKLERSPKVS